MEAKVNVNDYVKVKLTQHGIKLLKEKHEELKNHYLKRGYDIIGEFKLEIDEDGYSKFQLHELMFHFGHLMYNGNNHLPFETDIILTKYKTVETT